MSKKARKNNFTPVRKQDKELPVFVYGTLLPGHGNYAHFLEGYTLMEENGTMKGKMYNNHDAYPVVDVTEEGVVKGVVMHIKPNIFQGVLDGLDNLEGYTKGYKDNLYERVVVDVTTVSGSVVQCYTYSKGALFNEYCKELPVIESGSWDEYVKSTHPTVAIKGDNIKFTSKQSLITQGASSILNEEQISELLTRHFSGDWGLSEDKKLNNRALKNGDDAMMSVFEVNDHRVWVYIQNGIEVLQQYFYLVNGKNRRNDNE